MTRLKFTEAYTWQDQGVGAGIDTSSPASASRAGGGEEVKVPLASLGFAPFLQPKRISQVAEEI